MTNGKRTRKVPLTKIISFRATPEDWARMVAIEDRTGATPGWQLRKAVEKWLKQQEAGR